jgi:hypothetical protein
MLKPKTCPDCLKDVSFFLNPSGKYIEPEPGDLCHCSGCNTVLTYKPDLTLRISTEKDKLIFFAKYPSAKPYLDRIIYFTAELHKDFMKYPNNLRQNEN